MIEAGINVIRDEMGGDLKGALNLPLGDTAALRAVGYATKFAGFIDALGPGGKDDINDGSRVGGRVSLLWEPTPELKITPRVIYQKAIANGFNREEVFNLYLNPFTVPSYTYDEREQFLLMQEKFSDETWLADLVASYDFGPVELTSVTSYINRDILVSRDASALTHSVSVDLGLDDAVLFIPSNLRDTTDLKQWTQEVRLASTGAGPLQYVVGFFYTDIDRFYTQRLPTPGYAAFVDAALGAGTSAAVANGFPDLDSPYNADLPYDIRQTAIFGEGSYDFGQFKLTAGGRYYDFKETRDFINGGLFAPGQTLIGQETKSDGFSPRVIGTWEPNRNLSVNLQAAKGFRLGGINDPINLTLCSDEDEAIFGPFQGAYEDETLWNYEGGVKYSTGILTFNAAVFHTKIKNLQVTVDAGTCSSRIVFNVPKAHTTGIEAEFAAQPLPGLDLSLAGSYVEAEFDSTISNPALIAATGIREGNRLPTVPKFQMAAVATYSQPINADSDWYVSASYQHVGSRYTQPADQENNPRTFVHGLPVFGMPAGASTTLDLKLPSYDLVNLSAGIDWGQGLETVVFVNNLLDDNPRLSFDRERGGRARLGYNIGQPRTIGLTVRKRFGQY
jgi:outer membrane receptor protein involved in Fe transport